MTTLWRYAAAIAAVILVTLGLTALRPLANETTVALVFVMTVLFVAAWAGSGPAIASSIAAALGYNFFFLPPVGTLTIADPRNWVALAAMLAVGIAVGELSRRVRRRADEVEASRRDSERLLHRLEEAFDREAEIEASRRSERLKVALLDGVTHDLRTPLTSIKASITALLGSGAATLDAASRQELLQVVDEEADRLDRLVEELVAMARIEAQALHLARRWTSLSDVVDAAVSRNRPRAGSRRIVVSLSPELPSVFVDARAIEEALYLLVENALKYSAPDGTVTVSGAASLDETIEVLVDDDGPGVSEAERETIFATFTRGAGASPGGLGMGLAIVRGLIEAHGGTVIATDRPMGEGARFIIRLPIGDDEA